MNTVYPTHAMAARMCAVRKALLKTPFLTILGNVPRFKMGHCVRKLEYGSVYLANMRGREISSAALIGGWQLELETKLGTLVFAY